jgi:hypothetical protein
MQTNDYSKKPAATPAPDANRDPITGTPGAHPVGTGLGAAAAGAAAGAVGGAVAGPVGAAAGAVIGAVAGGLAGKGAAEAVNPTTEHEYWRGKFSSMPYAAPGSRYDDFGPAYQHGWESYGKYGRDGKDFASVESDVRRDWDKARGNSGLDWDRAKDATRDAWRRMDENMVGPGGRGQI